MFKPFKIQNHKKIPLSFTKGFQLGGTIINISYPLDKQTINLSNLVLGGRLVSHMGYGSKGVGALQLAHWARSISLRLEVQVFVFDKDLGDFINPLELSLTKKLKPLIGKSK